MLFALLLPFALQAQVVLQGKVSDAENGEALAYCHIQVAGTSLGVLTDEAGKFSIDLPGSTEIELIISYIGYETLQLKMNPEKFVHIKLLQANTSLHAVVVSGSMQEVSRINSSIPVDVFTSAYFRKNPTPNIFEALSLVNGVQPQINCNVCNAGDIHINGMEGAYTMVLIDGMPIVSSLSTVYGLSGIPNSLIKRIEVVKGPASTLYGSEAVAGLINIITKDPDQNNPLHIDAFATSYGEYNADIALNFRAGNHKSLLGINHFNYWNPVDRNGDNFTDLALQRRTSFFNKYDFKRKNNLKAGMALRYIYEERWGGEMQWNRSLRGSDEVYAESVFTNRFEVLGNYELSNKHGNLFLDYSFNKHLQDSYYGTDPFMAQQDVAFAQLRWSKQVNKHQVLAGLPFRYIYYDDNTPGTANVNGTNAPVQTFLPGLFIQDEWAINSKFNLLTGMRYDHHNQHGKILSPRLAMRYRTGENSTLRLSTGNGFRVVNLFTEDHAALSGSREVIIQNELRPEQSWNINTNYQTSIIHKYGFIAFDLTAFFTHFSNKIVGDFLTDPNKIIYDNLDGYAISKGFALNLESNFSNGLKFMTGATFMDVYQIEMEEGSNEQVRVPQLFAPRFSGVFTLSYQIPGIALNIDLSGRWMGPMYLPVVPDDFRPEKSPWFCLMNVQFSKSFSNQLEIYAGVKNLLNFVPENPLLRPFDPFDRSIELDNPNNYRFDTAYNYAPLQGIRGFFGLRYTLP
ncbi:MAG TPA: TonB-dependent receptor [Cyclobacteriaceae bacterium]|nr:TonB-dependent receptor [Cyclobacteriaceae bacterium]